MLQRMYFEGTPFLWGRLLFGKLLGRYGGHFACTVIDLNSWDDAFVELRVDVGACSHNEQVVWMARSGSTNFLIHNDRFPENLASLVSRDVVVVVINDSSSSSSSSHHHHHHRHHHHLHDIIIVIIIIIITTNDS